MSVTRYFVEARSVLGLSPTEVDVGAIKKAYRRAVAEHPPDTDPDAFRKIRDAYEMLKDPWSRTEELLAQPLPEAPPPTPPEEPARAPRGATAVALLRLAVADVDQDSWTAAKPRGRPKKETR